MTRIILALLFTLSVAYPSESMARGSFWPKWPQLYSKVEIIKGDPQINYAIAKKDEQSLYIYGSLTRPWGRSAYWTKVTATFLDEQGKVVAQKKSSVIYNGGGRRIHDVGSFYVRTKYDPKITRCRIEIQW